MLSHTQTRTHAHKLHTCTHTTRRGSETSNDETARNSIDPSQQSAGKHPRASARAPQTARRTRASYPVHVIRARAIAGARARVGFLRFFRRTAAPVSSLRKTRDSLIVVQCMRLPPHWNSESSSLWKPHDWAHNYRRLNSESLNTMVSIFDDDRWCNILLINCVCMVVTFGS